MFAFIRKRREQRKSWRNVEQYNAGYDYASGQLVRCGHSARERLLDEANNPFDRTCFELGMLSAIADFMNRCGCVIGDAT